MRQLSFALPILFGFTVLSSTALGAAVRSDLRRAIGVKRPNSPAEGTAPVSSFAWTADLKALGGFNELVPFVLRSPDQEDAGSCLYMATTGIAEFSLARLHPQTSRAPDGPLDLSERWLMNKANETGMDSVAPNWRTDTIYLFNDGDDDHSQRSVRNTAYRFTKGWYGEEADGDYVRVPANTTGAAYGTPLNWFDERHQISGGSVALPKFARSVLYKDPNEDQWAVGGMPQDIVSRVKSALRTKKAPVLVLYNHFSYWHAVFIVGFDDEADSGGCQFVRDSRDHFRKTYGEVRAELDAATDADERERLRRKLDKIRRTWDGLETAWTDGDGCSGKGMFYVRDSIYADASGPTYDFDPSRPGDEAPYSLPIVLHEYEWLEYLGNHAVQVYVKD